MSLKFPLPLPELWFKALDPTEIAYTIAFSVGISQSRKNESPLDAGSIENMETNSIDLNDSSHGYYGLGVEQVDKDADGSSLWFEVETSTSERGSYRSGGYMEPDEYPDLVLDDISLEAVMINTGFEEKELNTSQEFGSYPDFTFQEFNDLLYSYVEGTLSYDDSEVSYKVASAFPPSILKKITEFVTSRRFIDVLIENMDKIEPDVLTKVIEFYDLDMKPHRGRIAGKKFGL